MEKKKAANPGLEEYIAQLEEISDKMEDGSLTVDMAMELYRQGQEIAKKAEALLKKYKKDIEVLTEDDDEQDH